MTAGQSFGRILELNLNTYFMHAVIETGGKQYLVAVGDKVQIEKLEGEAGETVKFDKVLFTTDGKTFAVGKPYVSGSVVEGTVVKQARTKKIRVLKYKPKSRYRRSQGHRQHFTEVTITKI